MSAEALESAYFSRCPNVDHSQAAYLQAGSYRTLFSYARRCSRSKYCLFVDVDEFWVADPFPKSVSEFIAEQEAFDVYSFHWILTCNESLFSPPFAPVQGYVWDYHLKSICAYDSEYMDLGVHAPTLSYADNLIIMKGNSLNADIDYQFSGIVVHPVSRSFSSSPIGEAGLAWIVHRILRSEIEYSFRLFKPRADVKDKGFTAFKTNRFGFDFCSPFDSPPYNSGICEYFRSVLPEDAVSRYHRSLADFLDECSLHDLIEQARSTISEQEIYARLENLPPEVLCKDTILMKSIFKGTRFYDWVLAHT